MLGYIIVCGIGFTVLVISLIFAEIGDLFSNLDHDITGHTDGHTGPGFLSIRSVMAFLTGFGATGALFMSLDWSALHACLPALGIGLLMSIIAWVFSYFLYMQQGDSNYSTISLINKQAIVVTPIGLSSLGSILVSTPGGSVKLAASVWGTGAIEANRQVKIISIINQVAFVSEEKEASKIT